MINIRIVVIVFLVCIFSSILSQFSLSGIVTDTKGDPIPFAAVGLYEGGKQINLAKTSADGNFIFKNLPANTYDVQIKMLGYKSAKVSAKILANTTLPTIKLSANYAQIDEIVVQANRTTKASNIEKKEYSASQLLNSQNASAAELIGNIPSLNIGGESNSLSLRGDESVTVLINGKISSLTGESLSQIPASAIEKVEVITNPTAKNNSEGSAGIVNIVLKKAYNQVNSGFVAGSIGNNHKYNAQVGYNFSVNKFAFSTAYSFKYEEFYKWGIADRKFFKSGNNSYFQQISNGLEFKPNHFFRLGVEYQITPFQTLIATGSISKTFQNDYETRVNKNLDNQKMIFKDWDRIIWENDNNLIYDATLSYTLKNPKNSNVLSIEYSLNGNDNERENQYENKYKTLDYLSSTQTEFNTISNYQRRTTNILQADYTMPISNHTTFETGARGSIRDFRFTNLYKDRTSNGEMEENTALTNNFNYEEAVYSIYGVLSHQFTNKLSTKAGLRLEQTNTQSTNFNTISIYNYNYFYALPSMILNYKLTQKSNISGSYALRINRPSPGMLNPLQDVSDPQSLRFGNPELKPEQVHSFEIAYGQDVNKQLNFSTTLYHKRSSNSITRFLQIDALGVANVAVDNIGQMNMSGWEVILNYRPTKWLNLSYNSNLSYNTLSYTNQNTLYENDYLNWLTRLVTNVKLPLDMDFQGIIFYTSPRNTPQGQIDFISNVDLTLRKKIFGQKGLITFGVQDLLDHKRFEIRVQDVNFDNYFYRKRETRIWTLGFRYNFGADPSKKTANLEKQQKQDSGIDGL